MIVGSLAIAVIAYIICLATLNTGARYFAMMLMPAVVGRFPEPTHPISSRQFAYVIW